MSKYETIVQTRVDQLVGGDTVRYGYKTYTVAYTPKVYYKEDGERPEDTLYSFTLSDGPRRIEICAFANDTMSKVTYNDDALLADLLGE